MPSLKITRIVINHFNGVKHEKVIMQAEHRNHTALHRIYNLLLANQALEGGDKIIYTRGRKTSVEYRLCIICAERAVEGGKLVRCSKCCQKPDKSQGVILPLDQTVTSPTKPKPDYAKFYKY